MDAPFVAVARVIKTHGLQGEVAVKTLSDLPFALLIGTEMWAVPPVAGLGSLRLSAFREGPKGPLLTLDGVHSINEARSLAGSTLLVRAQALPEDWEEDVFDPVGYAVADADRGALGTITDVIHTGANDVWVIDGPLGQVLVPVIDDVVVAIDEEAETIDVVLLPGLLDED